MRWLVIALAVTLVASPARADEAPVLTTSITGSVDATGKDDPQYALSFVAIQKLMLAAAHHPLSPADVEAAVRGTPFTTADLVRLELLVRAKDGFRLGYLLLTADDQQALYRTSAKFGASLADAFRARKADFDRALAQYPDATLRADLLFALVAGASLNWDGLRLTSELGYRVEPPRHANGHRYLVHSAERGVKLDYTGLYLDSQSAPGGKRLVFATYGDGDSLPRLEGLPDVFDGIEAATAAWKPLPDAYGALQGEYLSLVLEALDDAAAVMTAIAAGHASEAELARAVAIPDARRKAIVQVLVAIGYVELVHGEYAIRVPTLVARDKPMIDAVMKLGREIMTAWLRRNYGALARELATLSPMKNGLPFALAFSEAWHYTFGFATRSLAETGFYADPRAHGSRRPGYVPLVFEPSLIAWPQ